MEKIGNRRKKIGKGIKELERKKQCEGGKKELGSEKWKRKEKKKEQEREKLNRKVEKKKDKDR